MSSAFEIIRDEGPVPLLRLSGRLEDAGAKELRSCCMEIYKTGNVVIFVNLKQVTFVSSSGLGTFLYLTELFRQGGGKAVFIEPSGAVIDVITLLNLDRFLEISDSVEAALTIVEI